MIFKRRGLEKIPLKNCLCEKGCKKRGEEEKKKMYDLSSKFNECLGLTL